ncbi:MAG: Hsp20/alpha crystallin family protein [Deltaproteobacteria bacterium]|nr:Hsp20/alpha crystallin family protein [Deltaproteobacteria bacterium]
MSAPEVSVAVPAVDLYEGVNDWLILADLPGASQDQLSLELARGVLTLSAPRREGEVWRRVFRVPESVDAERVSASVDRGVLRVTLPKRERERPRKIEVAVG